MERLQLGVADRFPSHPPPGGGGVLGRVALPRAGLRAEPEAAVRALGQPPEHRWRCPRQQTDRKPQRGQGRLVLGDGLLSLGVKRERGPRVFPRRWAEEGSETCVEVVKFSALAQPGDDLARNQAFRRWGNRLGTAER